MGDNTPLANVYVVEELGFVDVVLLYKNIVAWFKPVAPVAPV
jgi:hypothetical protein